MTDNTQTEALTITLTEFIRKHAIDFGYRPIMTSKQPVNRKHHVIVTMYIPDETVSYSRGKRRTFSTRYFYGTIDKSREPVQLENVLDCLMIDINTVEGSTDANGVFDLYDYVLNFSDALNIERKHRERIWSIYNHRTDEQVRKDIKSACFMLQNRMRNWGQKIDSSIAHTEIANQFALYKHIIKKDKELQLFLGKEAYDELHNHVERL